MVNFIFYMFDKFIPTSMTRQEANTKILSIIKANCIAADFVMDIQECINKYPQQRFGQIICNYICPDYRDSEPSIETKAFMNAIFPENPDPFYEESVETYNRLRRK